MSNVITFLESLGQDANLSRQTPEQFAAAVAALDLEDAPRTALLARDATRLNDLLGGRDRILCALFPAEDDNQKSQEDEDQPLDDVPDDAQETPRQPGSN